MITVSNMRSLRNDLNLFSFANELIGNPYGARYPVSFGGPFLRVDSPLYSSVTTTARTCVLKAVCVMSMKRKDLQRTWNNLPYLISR
jgi:hypothetical protein